VRYWLHGGLLQVNAEKMSKSLGNFMLLRDVLEKYEAPVVRLMMLQTHYRSPLEFSTDRLDEARSAYERLVTPLRDLEMAKRSTDRGLALTEQETTAVTNRLKDAIHEARRNFTESMDDDFNTAGALGAIFGLVRELNSFIWEGPGIGLEGVHTMLLDHAAVAIRELAGVLGIELVTKRPEIAEYPPDVFVLAADYAGYSGASGAEAVDALCKARDVSRSERNWAVADAIRNRMNDIGFLVEDKPDGTHISYESR
ncbi:MAG: cysteine--tRNA ligase, partial [Coriobacteriia bacterium]|nr:cysteine--tRNA ligase [Coriobacteriia bacterium]